MKSASTKPPHDLDPMRYLKQRGSSWHYVRRVPKHFSLIDSRGIIQISLKTRSIEVARLRRDLLENADDMLWHGLSRGDDGEAEARRYKVAQARAKAFGFEYKTAAAIAAHSPFEEVLARIEVVKSRSTNDIAGALGAVAEPQITVRKAMALYCEEIGLGETKGMSINQHASWKKVKLAAAERFIEAVGNKALLEITRADATKFHGDWQKRVMGGDGERPISGNTANRSLGNMRKLFREYAAHIGRDIRNPFDGLAFSDSKRKMKKILPFTTDWISTNLLAANSLSGLNREARLILLVMVETGCRPSEICNLSKKRIHLNHNVPHIVVDFEDDRAIKTENSIRVIPLTGVSLDAMRMAPEGFPHYRDRETLLSNTLMKYLRTNGLLPSDNHRVYSLRHSFENRMLEAGINDEFRKRLMGHDIDRPDYGDGGQLSWKLEQIQKITLDFDPAVLAGGAGVRRLRGSPRK
ncbi:MAG: integrase [Bradyrhizobium sp.]|nr:integrase [Bradyrhizobium sp.]